MKQVKDTFINSLCSIVLFIVLWVLCCAVLSVFVCFLRHFVVVVVVVVVVIVAVVIVAVVIVYVVDPGGTSQPTCSLR